MEQNDKKSSLNSSLRLGLFLLGSVGLIILSIVAATAVLSFASITLSEAAYEAFLESDQYLAWVNFLGYVLLGLTFGALLSPYVRSIRWRTFVEGNAIVKALGYTLLIIAIQIMVGFLYESFEIGVEDNNNQQIIVSLVNQFPLMSAFTFIFLGPICEEITYRVGLFKFTSNFNRPLAYVATAVIFGFIHFDYAATNLINELANLPLYVLAGVIFSFVYDKEGPEVATMSHIANNLISILLILAGSWVGASS